MSVPPTPEDIAARAAEALFSKKLLTNVHRAVVVEAIVSSALGDDWEWCSGDYASCDFKHADGTRLEIKQSASLQSWNAASLLPSVCQFDIAERNGEWKGSVWHNGKGRNADIYVLCHHPIVSAEADHRDPVQWRFFVVREPDLPKQHSIRLTVLEKLRDRLPMKGSGRPSKQSVRRKAHDLPQRHRQHRRFDLSHVDPRRLRAA